METDKTFPSDDPNVTLTIRLIMQGKVRLFLFLLQCIFVMAEEASYGFFHCTCSIGMYKVCTSRTVVPSKFTISKGLSHSKKLSDYKSSLKENYSWTIRWIKQVFWIICHTKLLLPWSIILSFNIGYHLLCILWKGC